MIVRVSVTGRNQVLSSHTLLREAKGKTAQARYFNTKADTTIQTFSLHLVDFRHCHVCLPRHRACGSDCG
jgi:hypothetical protein